VAPVVLALAGTSSLALVPLTAWTLEAARAGTRWADVRARLREQLTYIVPRIPAAAAFNGLLAIGPFLAPHFGTLTEAGYLVAGQSLLRVVEAGTAGFGLVVLPRVAALYAQQRPEYVRDRVEDLVGLTLHAGLFAAGQLAVWTPEIVHAWLGADFAPAVPIIRVLVIGLVPYLGYTMLRLVVDAVEVRAINARNVYAALAVVVTLSLGLGAAGFGAFGLAIGSVGGLAVLGGRTVRFLRSRLGFAGDQVALPLALTLNLFAVASAVAVRALAVEHLEGAVLATCAVGGTVMLAVLYLLVLRRRKVRWLIQVEQRLRGRGAAA
jgi:O-antigen/teichoic acid export membrane protein